MTTYDQRKRPEIPAGHVLVEMIESEFEPGWGASQRTESWRSFETMGEAVTWCDDYNREYNNEKEVPNYYIKPHIYRN